MITIPETPFTRDGLLALAHTLRQARAELPAPRGADVLQADALLELSAAAQFSAELLELEPAPHDSDSSA